MTPFDPNLPPNAAQPLDQDDLIAFHLHELPQHQVRAVNRALRNNPTLQAESVAIASTLRAFPKHEPALPLDASALDRHWQTLRPSLAPHVPVPLPPRTIFPRTLVPRWTLPTLAGSALLATTLFVAWHYTRPNQQPTLATTTTLSSTTPTPVPPETSQPNPPTSPQSNPVNPLPLPPHRAWHLSSAPIETATANTPAPIFAAQTPTPLTPTSPSTPDAGTTSPAATPPPSSNPAQTQPSTQLSTPPTPASIQPGKSPRTSTPHPFPATELTLAMFGDLTASRSSNDTSGTGTSAVPESFSQTASPAIGALASFRQQLRPWLGYRVTTTYTSPSFESAGINTHYRIYEFSGTYVVQGPHHRRLTTSVEAGASLLDFLFSTADYYPAPPSNGHVLRGAGVVGVGAEYALTKHWGLRAEYRALGYKPPTFTYISGAASPPSTLTFSSNPIFGITYRFGANGAD